MTTKLTAVYHKIHIQYIIYLFFKELFAASLLVWATTLDINQVVLASACCVQNLPAYKFSMALFKVKLIKTGSYYRQL